MDKLTERSTPPGENAVRTNRKAQTITDKLPEVHGTSSET